MKRSELKTFIKAGVDALNLWFGRGQISDFNSSQGISLPAVWQETQPADSEVTQMQSVINEWGVVLHIVKKDTLDSSPEQYEAIIDECDEIAQKLIVQYNQVVSGSNLIQLSTFKREPIIKQHVTVLTGVKLSFTMMDPDTTNYCP